MLGMCMNSILTFSSSSFTGGEAGKNVIGPVYQNVVHRRWTSRKKGSCCCCCCWKRSLIPSLLACHIRTIVAGLFAFSHHPSSGRFLLLLAGLWRLNHEEVVDIICCYHDDDATDRTQKINHAIVGEGNINRHFYVMISLGKEKMPLLWPACKRSTREAKFLAGIK